MYQNILFPVDLNEESSWKEALPAAVEYCKAFGATLHLINVVPDFGKAVVGSYFPKDYEEKAIQNAKQMLHDFAREHVPNDIETRIVIGNGSVYKEILRVAAEIKADLVLLASHRPELKDFLLGGNAERVVRHFEGSVLVVR